MKPPFRNAFGDREREMVHQFLEFYKQSDQDPPYDGHFQHRFENDFAKKMNGGFAIAVSSGSNASYIAIKSLELRRKKTILMSPVTDTSSLMALHLAGYIPIILDTDVSSYNTTLEQVEKAYRSDVGALYLVHTYGVPSDISRIYQFCVEKNIRLIEDCSQSPFATFQHQNKTINVGELGDYAIFSTMYRKSLHTSSSGGIVFTKKEDDYRIALEYSDRGRSKWLNHMSKDLEGDVSRFSLNFNTSEFACAVGLASLSRIDSAISERNRLINRLIISIESLSKYCRVMDFPKGSSPFLVPIVLTDLGLSKKEDIFAALSKASIPFAPQYHCFAYDWPMVGNIRKEILWKLILSFRRKLKYSNNASRLKQKAFNLFLHEGYSSEYIDYIASNIKLAFQSS